MSKNSHKHLFYHRCSFHTHTCLQVRPAADSASHILHWCVSSMHQLIVFKPQQRPDCRTFKCKSVQQICETSCLFLLKLQKSSSYQLVVGWDSSPIIILFQLPDLNSPNVAFYVKKKNNLYLNVSSQQWRCLCSSEVTEVTAEFILNKYVLLKLQTPELHRKMSQSELWWARTSVSAEGGGTQHRSVDPIRNRTSNKPDVGLLINQRLTPFYLWLFVRI